MPNSHTPSTSLPQLLEADGKQALTGTIKQQEVPQPPDELTRACEVPAQPSEGLEQTYFTPGAAATPSTHGGDRTLPFNLGKFVVTGRLGVGGMGEVFYAVDTVLDRECALKLLQEKDKHESQEKAELISEARKVAKFGLNDSHVVKIYEADEAAGVPYIAMELLATSLKAVLASRKTLEPLRAVQIARDCALGLAAAHKKGLIHRDIKPANVMLTSDGPAARAKLVDFGIAKQVDANTQSKSGGGTPMYMSPEQAKGQSTTRSDLYSLGRVLLQMCNGKLPCDWIAGHEAEINNLTGPKRLKTLIRSLLESEPAKRPQSAEAVVTELRAIEQEMTQPPKRRRALLWLVAGAILLGVVLLALLLRPGEGRVTVESEVPSARAVLARNGKTITDENGQPKLFSIGSHTLPTGSYTVDAGRGFRAEPSSFDLTSSGTTVRLIPLVSPPPPNLVVQSESPSARLVLARNGITVTDEAARPKSFGVGEYFMPTGSYTADAGSGFRAEPANFEITSGGTTTVRILVDDKDRTAAIFVITNGGSVRVRKSDDSEVLVTEIKKLPADKFKVSTIDLGGTKEKRVSFKDDDLKEFVGLSKLRRLDAGWTKITHSGLETIAKLPVEELILDGNKIAKGLTSIQAHKRLKVLSLNATDVAFRDVGYFDKIPNLDTLHVKVTDLKEADFNQTRQKKWTIYVQDKPIGVQPPLKK